MDVNKELSQFEQEYICTPAVDEERSRTCLWGALTYLLKTEQFDRSRPHTVMYGQAMPGVQGSQSYARATMKYVMDEMNMERYGDGRISSAEIGKAIRYMDHKHLRDTGDELCSLDSLKRELLELMGLERSK